MRFAELCPTASAIVGVISPYMESAMAMPEAPTIISALRQFTTTAFSPVAACSAPALSIALVANAFVPTAIISDSGKAAFNADTS